MSQMPKLQPRRAPEPGRPFVNREPELQFIEDKLRPGRQGETMAMVVTCFWGAFGIGKSWLLGELERRYRRVGLRSSESCPTVVARLDMSPRVAPALWRDDRLNVEQVVQELWRQLALQLGTDLPDLRQAGVEEWADQFVEQVTAWVQHATPILMLDNMDYVIRDDEDAFFRLEAHLVERLALTDQVLFVFSSRGELRRWQRFQVRRRVDSYPLAAFDAGSAGREVSAGPAASKLLFRHAFGHPLATEYLGTALTRYGIDVATATEVEIEEVLRETSLVRAVLNEVTQQILDRCPLALARLARLASVLRWVNVEPLRHLAERLGLNEGRCGDADYLELIGELQAQHLHYWNVEAATYRSDPAVRRLLAHGLELDDTSAFRAAHVAALSYHVDHLRRFPGYLARYVPEVAFHTSVLMRDGLLPPELPAFSEWWQAFLSGPVPGDPEPWAELQDALETDGELREVMTPAEHRALSSATQSRAASAQSF